MIRDGRFREFVSSLLYRGVELHIPQCFAMWQIQYGNFKRGLYCHNFWKKMYAQELLDVDGKLITGWFLLLNFPEAFKIGNLTPLRSMLIFETHSILFPFRH